MMPVTNSVKRIPIYNSLRKYLKDDQLITALENAYALSSQPLRITTCGVLKAGKSSLLNALTDHLDPELFKEGSVRTTIQNQTFKHHDFIFVDTPGIDAKEEDDTEARKGIATADVLLFVHHPGTGELHANEVDLLKKLCNQGEGGSEFNKQLVVVLTYKESHTETIEFIGNKIISQIKNNCRVEPELFKVSNSSYKKGMYENKKKLIEYSGIPLLRQHLFDNLVANQDNARVVRQSRIRTHRKPLMNAVVSAITERREKLSTIQSKTDQAHEALARDSEALVNALRSKFAAYEAIY
jgi:tRNA U34 5-carboxymethylaminomethyl modifying GTPase MnmE/TrmE